MTFDHRPIPFSAQRKKNASQGGGRRHVLGNKKSENERRLASDTEEEEQDSNPESEAASDDHKKKNGISARGEHVIGFGCNLVFFLISFLIMGYLVSYSAEECPS